MPTHALVCLDGLIRRTAAKLCLIVLVFWCPRAKCAKCCRIAHKHTQPDMLSLLKFRTGVIKFQICIIPSCQAVAVGHVLREGHGTCQAVLWHQFHCTRANTCLSTPARLSMAVTRCVYGTSPARRWPSITSTISAPRLKLLPLGIHPSATFL